MISTWNPYRHRVCNSCDNSVARWIDREFPEIRGLFVYLHLLTGNWVIARWVCRQAGQFSEVFMIGSSLGDFTRDNALEVRKRLRQPPENREIARRILDEEYRTERMLTDESMEGSERRSPRKIQVTAT